MEEEGLVIVGMLVGLNIIDANLCVKGEDLDSQVRHRIHTHTHSCYFWGYIRCRCLIQSVLFGCCRWVS